ncbi:MAG: hypothetical protein ACYCS9_02265 [Candidatus Dormibacteria bacterium]
MDARLRWMIWASVAVAAVVVSSAGVLASTGSPKQVSRVSGFEIAATSTDGQFVGSIGSGTPLGGGYFYANVIHQVLQESPGGDTTAICGTGESSSSSPSPYPCDSTNPEPVSTVTVYLDSRSVTGQFEYAPQGITFEGNSGGTSSCPSTQTFLVSDVVNFSKKYGSYDFSVTLTHYSYELFGDCITYFATISGTMTLK